MSQSRGSDPAVVVEPVARTAPTAADLRYELSPDLVTLGDSRPSEAEAIRTIRTHIVARHLEDGRRGLAICGPTDNIGCTFTAVNLAVALSQVGIATLLIDGDLRNPAVEAFLRPERPTTGLKQCLEGDGHLHLHDYVHPEVLPNLSVLYSGGVAPNAQELLAGDGFKRLIQTCLRDFQFTLIDTPAITKGADALRVSSIIGYTLVVARANVTRNSELAHLAEQLHEDGARIIGTVLNEV
jgi:protein-tyrosine kinase